jgi:murein DD-endopeptidase MepM/ murein hydrolase activator NlpD
MMKTSSGIQSKAMKDKSTLRISIADMMALHVRTQDDKTNKRPELLYQRLPIKAIALMATIPSGDFAVSIPHQSELGGGYPILESVEMAADGILVVYARQQNGRYESERVIFQGRTYGMAEFHEVARQWVEMHAGRLRVVPGRYAYFMPTQKLWGVILRDNGYIALDPSIVSSEISPESLENGIHYGHGIARVLIFKGDKQMPGDALPVFQQVELTFDPHPTSQSAWTDFNDDQRARAIRARPPACMMPEFREWLQRFTVESGFERWIFRPGMFFGDRVEWWGFGNRRRSEHEGVDFIEGSMTGAGVQRIPEGTPVRVMADGEVMAFWDDFLGKTVVVRHPSIIDPEDSVFHTLYSHIEPEALQFGPIAKGEILGRVRKLTAAGAPAHLHLTGAWIPQSISSEKIIMDYIDPAFVPVVLINFNDLLPTQS